MPVSLSAFRFARTCFTALARLSASLSCRQSRCHSCSSPPLRFDLQTSADQRGSLPHAEKALALSGRRARAGRDDIESPTIVPNDECEAGIIFGKLDDDG